MLTVLLKRFSKLNTSSSLKGHIIRKQMKKMKFYIRWIELSRQENYGITISQRIKKYLHLYRILCIERSFVKKLYLFDFSNRFCSKNYTKLCFYKTRFGYRYEIRSYQLMKESKYYHNGEKFNKFSIFVVLPCLFLT